MLQATKPYRLVYLNTRWHFGAAYRTFRVCSLAVGSTSLEETSRLAPLPVCSLCFLALCVLGEHVRYVKLAPWPSFVFCFETGPLSATQAGFWLSASCLCLLCG